MNPVPTDASPVTSHADVPVLSIQNAALYPLWDNLNLDVYPGEIVLIQGKNGSGKSSLFGAILGTRKLSSGSITYPMGHSPTIGYIPQQDLMNTQTSIRGRDLVELASAHGIFSHRTPDPTHVEETLQRVEATQFADYRMGLLSGGQQQKIRQAQAIITRPELMLCDEPMTSLDTQAQKETAQLLQYQAKVEGSAVLCISHDDMFGIADRVITIPGEVLS